MNAELIQKLVEKISDQIDDTAMDSGTNGDGLDDIEMEAYYNAIIDHCTAMKNGLNE